MANEEQLSILRHGVDVWNEWRVKNFSVDIDLSNTSLSRANLRGVNLKGTNLRDTNFDVAVFDGGDLSGSDLRGSNFWRSSLRDTNLSAAKLNRADLNAADLSDANLREADLGETNLSGAQLIGAHADETNLDGANLGGANLRAAVIRGSKLGSADLSAANLQETRIEKTDLQGSNFGKTVMGNTVLDDVDLSQVLGLDHVQFSAPSILGRTTFVKSSGKIPEAFLRGCGLSDWEIEETKLFDPNLSNGEISEILYKVYDLRATQALQISPLFISYSHADSQFVDKFGSYLDQKGIRYWRDIHKATAGPLEEQVNRAIRQNPTVLVVLSENSIKSDWVQHEVRAARETGKEMGRHVLCPVALDDSWKTSPWPKRIMEQIMEYNILDFSEWEHDSRFYSVFRKLIDGLELFYKG